MLVCNSLDLLQKKKKGGAGMRMLKLFFLEKTGLVDSNDIKSRSLRESVFEKKISFKYVVKND